MEINILIGKSHSSVESHKQIQTSFYVIIKAHTKKMKIILTPLFRETYQVFYSCHSLFSIMMRQRICLIKYREKKSEEDEATKSQTKRRKKNRTDIFPCLKHISI